MTRQSRVIFDKKTLDEIDRKAKELNIDIICLPKKIVEVMRHVSKEKRIFIDRLEDFFEYILVRYGSDDCTMSPIIKESLKFYKKLREEI